MLLGWHMVRNYRGHYYAKAQNLARQLRAAYDAVLADYDLLLMPTLPVTATPIPEANAPMPEILQRAFEMLPQHRAVRRHRPSGDEPALRLERRPAGRADADRPAATTRGPSIRPPTPTSRASTGRPDDLTGVVRAASPGAAPRPGQDETAFDVPKEKALADRPR